MNYWDYIKVEQLLGLQSGTREDGGEPGDDEVLFITVHQVYELWFKVMLRELTALRDLFRQNPVPDQKLATAVRGLNRCVTIFRVATQHWEVVETLTTRDYLAFRDHLIGASGFQSAQMRQIEVLLGLDDTKRIACAGEGSYLEVLRGSDGDGSPALERVRRQIADRPSLKDALYEWLSRTPIDGSTDPADVDRYVERFIAAHEAQAQRMLQRMRELKLQDMDDELLEQRYQRDIDRARAFFEVSDLDGLDPEARQKRRHVRAALVFIESHRELPRLAWPREVVASTVALEQAMVVWRARHARMVERMIGRRTGTGGSGGVDYLDLTALAYRIFDDIWEVRTILLRQGLCPELEREEEYRFAVEDRADQQ